MPSSEPAPSPSPQPEYDSVWVVVPTFNEESTISAVVSDLYRMSARVLVVDDGSRDQTAALAEAAGALVLRHPENLGQGAALRTGIAHALEAGAAVVVTFDGDNQHRATDLAPLVQPILEGRADVTLGSRFLEGQTRMPLRRRLELRLAIWLTRHLTGLPLSDTHNGLRAFSRDAAFTVQFAANRWAHASQILDQIAIHDLDYVEVPVRISYLAQPQRRKSARWRAVRTLSEYVSIHLRQRAHLRKSGQKGNLTTAAK